MSIIQIDDWTVERHADGSFRLRDVTGKTRGRYADPGILAAHLAMALKSLDAAQAANAELRRQIEQGAELVPAVESKEVTPTEGST